MEKLFAITLLTLISVVEIIFMLMGTMLPLAAVLISLILLLVFLMIFRTGSRHFWRMSSLLFLINLLVAIYLLLKLGTGWPTLLACFMALSGLVFSEASAKKMMRHVSRVRVVSTRPSAAPEKKQESHTARLIENYIRSLDEKEIRAKSFELKDAKDEERPHTVVRKTFTHGRYLASKTGRQYHKPRCNWAKNIRKENQLWFATAEEAEGKGYTKHSCLSK